MININSFNKYNILNENHNLPINKIDELKREIKKRDELIYSLLYHTSNYISFMHNSTINIDKLRKIYNTEELVDKEIAKNRIDLLK